MSQGTIIFLNGTTSAGKTSTARMLQTIMAEPYLEAGIDTFLWMLPRRYFKKPLWDQVLGQASHSGEMGHQLISGMHHAILTLSKQGLNVVADHVLVEKRWLDECVRMFYDQPAYLIGLRCPLDVLEQRENNRANDRTPGQAKKQINLVHAHEIYDLEVDTSRYNIEECARQIKDRIESGEPPSALKKLYFRSSQPT